MRATRDLVSPLPVALALAAAALFLGGGSGTGSLPWIGGAAVAAAVAFVVTRGFPPGWTAFLPLAGLAAWCALSVVWSDAPDRSWEYANRTLVYLAFAVVGAYVPPRTRQLAVGFAALLGAVAVWALAGKVFPWLYEDYGRIARLRTPVGYWNGLALLGDIALPLGLWIALRRRIVGALLVYAWLVALALTFSRGGAIVAVLVVAAWIALSRAWVDGIATLVAAGIPAALVVAAAFALDGVTADGTSHATRVRDGLVFGSALVAGVGILAPLALLPRPAVTPALRRLALGTLAVAAAAVLVLGALHAGSWWDSFTASSVTQVSNDKNRFGSAGSNFRWVWWKEAWRGFEDAPLTGNGTGAFHLTNLRYRGTYLDQATEPHDLPLQFLSETGVVGCALFLLSAAALLRAGFRRRNGPELALSLAFPAYLVHGLIDIDWDFAAVTAPVLLVAGALAARPVPEGRRAPSAFAVLTGAGVVLAVLTSLFTVWLGARWSAEASRSLSRPAHAIALAKRARSVNPTAVDPLFTQALAEQLRGNEVGALQLLRRATRVQPANPQAWYLLGAFLADAGCPHAALPPLEKFTELNPQDRGGALYNETLDRVNAGQGRC